MSDLRVLDNAVYTSLTGPHAGLAESKGRVRRYPVDVSPFAALPDDPGAADWADLAALAGPAWSYHWPMARPCGRPRAGRW